MITFGSDLSDYILQRTLSDNTLGLNNSILQMTSGYKINHAKDNAAGYSILTDLNTKISSMLQVQQNTEDGISLLSMAEGGLNEIESLLERLRELAMQASNGIYDEISRDAMQLEAEGIIAQIEQIRDNIKYDGRNLYETTSATTSYKKALQINDTISNTFTSTAAGARKMSAPASVSLFSSDIQGSIDIVAGGTEVVTIDGVEYTVTNKLSNTINSLSYSKNTSTGEVTFLGSNFKIQACDGVEHNIIINGNSNGVIGGNLNDKIQDSTNNKQNNLSGGDGDDIIITKSIGGSSIYGGNGNDTLTVTRGQNNVWGGAGDDVIHMGGNSAGVRGEAGNDTIYVTGTANNIYGGDGDDSFSISGSNNKIYGDAGNNTILADTGSGNIRVDVDKANAYAVNFTTAGETKTVEINGINYTIKSSSSNSTMIYTINDSGQINFRSNGFVIRGDINKAHNVLLSGANITFYGGNLADTIQSSGQYNSLYAGAGNDIIYTSSRWSYVWGEDGDDTLTLAGQEITADAGSGNDIIKSAGNYNSILAGDGDDIVNITGGSYVSAYGGSGNNTITNKGKKTLIAGFGSADNSEVVTLSDTSETKNVTINGINYTVKSRHNSGNTLFYSVNDVTGKITFGGNLMEIRGQADKEHNIEIQGWGNYVYTGNLNDTIENYGSGAYVYALGGDDEIKSAGIDTRVYGGEGNDNISVDAAYNYASGENGDDTITINATSSHEIHNGGNGNDTYNININTTVQDGGGDNIYNINTNYATVSGSTGNDTFYVNGNNNTVLGAGGDDYFIIDGDNNTIDGGTDNNLYIDNGQGTTLTNVNSDPNTGSLSFSYQNEVKTFTLNGKTYTVTNNLAGNNTLQYSINPNTGVITVNGSDLKIDASADEAAILNIRGNNNVINGSNLADRITVEQGSGNIINGNAGNDILTMSSADNSLQGGDGQDTLNLNSSSTMEINGGAGDDVINVNGNNNTNIIDTDGNNRLILGGDSNAAVLGDGNNVINSNGTDNEVKAGAGNNNITLIGVNNTLTAGNGSNKIGIEGDGNTLTLGNTVDDVNVYGNNNSITIENGESHITLNGNSNRFTTLSGDKSIVVRGNSNSIQGGSGADDIRISGNANEAVGGDGADSFVVSSGSDNIIDGSGGDNTLMDNGVNTQSTNVSVIKTFPFELNVKVDIGSGSDKYITTSISFNLYDFSVDFTDCNTSLESLNQIDDMLKNLRSTIVDIGSSINRLESVLEAQNIKLENMISTRSTLRDADIAEISSNYIRYQILQQASSTLLAASHNIHAQNVLGLLSQVNVG